MASTAFILFQIAIQVATVASSASVPAHPSFEPGICELPLATPKRVIDITHAYREDLPIWESMGGLGRAIEQVTSMKNGSIANQSEMKMGVHTGTHLDAPSHVFQEYYEAGFDVDTLDLDVLNGVALLVDVPRNTNLTAEAMETLKLPEGVTRVLFRTLNTDRRLMWKKEYDSSYVGFTTEGASWLAENTKIKLIACGSHLRDRLPLCCSL